MLNFRRRQSKLSSSHSPSSTSFRCWWCRNTETSWSRRPLRRRPVRRRCAATAPARTTCTRTRRQVSNHFLPVFHFLEFWIKTLPALQKNILCDHSMFDCKCWFNYGHTLTWVWHAGCKTFDLFVWLEFWSRNNNSFLLSLTTSWLFNSNNSFL